jgi:hypothetical protein
MFIHLIPLEELKRHSVTYWRPGRDSYGTANAWVILAECESGYSTTVLDVSNVTGALPSPVAAEDVLALFTRAPVERTPHEIAEIDR